MRPMLKKSRSAVWIGVALVSILAGQQAPFLIRGDYSRKVAWASTSPNQRYRLEVRRQAAFPAFRDPSGTAYFAIIDTRTGRPAARTVVPVQRFFALQQPTVEWSDQDVQVADFDQSPPPTSVRLLLAH
jgi:hypothetical protein